MATYLNIATSSSASKSAKLYSETEVKASPYYNTDGGNIAIYDGSSVKYPFCSSIDIPGLTKIMAFTDKNSNTKYVYSQIPSVKTVFIEKVSGEFSTSRTYSKNDYPLGLLVEIHGAKGANGSSGSSGSSGVSGGSSSTPTAGGAGGKGGNPGYINGSYTYTIKIGDTSYSCVAGQGRPGGGGGGGGGGGSGGEQGITSTGIAYGESPGIGGAGGSGGIGAYGSCCQFKVYNDLTLIKCVFGTKGYVPESSDGGQNGTNGGSGISTGTVSKGGKGGDGGAAGGIRGSGSTTSTKNGGAGGQGGDGVGYQSAVNNIPNSISFQSSNNTSSSSVIKIWYYTLQ